MGVNVGTVDRVIRVVVGIIMGVVAIYVDSLWSLIPAVVGVIALVTALSGRCGIYILFGVNTCRIKTRTPGE
jgi:hypothetical protein